MLCAWLARVAASTKAVRSLAFRVALQPTKLISNRRNRLMGEASTAVVMASSKENVSPEALRRETISAVVGLEFIFVWFDIGLGMVVNGLVSRSIDSGPCCSLYLVALILRLLSKRPYADHTRGAVLTSPSNFMLVSSAGNDRSSHTLPRKASLRIYTPMPLLFKARYAKARVLVVERMMQTGQIRVPLG
jgi:hypothetical protein